MNNKFCRNCGSQITLDDLFCTQCGTKIEKHSRSSVKTGRGSFLKTRFLPIFLGLILIIYGLLYSALFFIGIRTTAIITDINQIIDQSSSAMDYDYEIRYRFSADGDTYTGQYRKRRVYDLRTLPKTGDSIEIKYLSFYKNINSIPAIPIIPFFLMVFGFLLLFLGIKPKKNTEITPVPKPNNDTAFHHGHEKILGIINSMRQKTGLFSSRLFNLVITNRRIIFANITKEMLNQAAKEAAEEGKAEGRGFLARSALMLKSPERISQKQWSMAPDSILQEDMNNFFIDYNDILSIKIRSGAYIHEQGQYENDRMIIKTRANKFNLAFESSNSSQAKELLKNFIG